MSNYEAKEGAGAAFFQNNKRNERQPDWTGKLHWKGEELQLSMWERKSKKNGMAYLAFQLGPKFVPGQGRQQEQPASRPQQSAAPEEGPNDDIPFAFAFLAPMAVVLAAAVYAGSGMVA